MCSSSLITTVHDRAVLGGWKGIIATFLRNLYTCDLQELVLARLHLESPFLSKNFHVWALFSKALYLRTPFSRNLYLRAWAACAQPCHRGPRCSHLLHWNTATDESNRTPTTCNNLTPTTLKATELPRLRQPHTYHSTVQLTHWTLNATLLHHTFLRFEKTKKNSFVRRKRQIGKTIKVPRPAHWPPLPQTHPWHVRTIKKRPIKRKKKASPKPSRRSFYPDHSPAAKFDILLGAISGARKIGNFATVLRGASTVHGQIRSIWIGVRKKKMFVWPVNKHVNCQVKDIELQFIVAPPRPHHTMLAISIAHLRMIWSTLFGRGQGEGWKQNFCSVESLWFFRSIPVMFWIHLCDYENLQGAKVQCWKGKEKRT